MVRADDREIAAAATATVTAIVLAPASCIIAFLYHSGAKRTVRLAIDGLLHAEPIDFEARTQVPAVRSRWGGRRRATAARQGRIAW